MKEKIEIQIEHACDECVLNFGECKSNPVFLSQVLSQYNIVISNPKDNDFVVACPERLVQPDDDND